MAEVRQGDRFLAVRGKPGRHGMVVTVTNLIAGDRYRDGRARAFVTRSTSRRTQAILVERLLNEKEYRRL